MSKGKTNLPQHMVNNARRAALEEAAKCCEEVAREGWSEWNTAHGCARRIRALADQPAEEGKGK